MKLTPLQCITIVAETVLAERLTEEIKRLGARGYTLIEACGEGSRHLRAGEIPGQNIRIEAVVSNAVAESIMDHIAHEYFDHYAVIVYVTDVQVVRGDKYV
ncbi:MAG: transcriptional regulator [Planctomycetota bacterium]